MNTEHDYYSPALYCLYCGRDIEIPESVPDPHDHDAWTQLATKHATDCEWIVTRAHQRDEIANEMFAGYQRCATRNRDYREPEEMVAGYEHGGRAAFPRG